MLDSAIVLFLVLRAIADDAIFVNKRNNGKR